jgi:hypothetical protein
MKAKELRIGNFIFEDDGIIAKIIGFCPFDNSVRCDEKEGCNLLIDVYPQDGTIRKGYEIDINFCKPIKLTEEWHNKFGVSKNGFNQFEYELPAKNNFHIKVVFNDDYVMIRQGGINQNPLDDDLVSVFNRDLVKRDMYIHEWQNLYFALTGKELIIKK